MIGARTTGAPAPVALVSLASLVSLAAVLAAPPAAADPPVGGFVDEPAQAAPPAEARPSSAPTAADYAEVPAKPRRVLRTEWYGEAPLAIDIASSLVAIGAGVAQQPILLAPAIGGYLLGAPIVHAVHGRGGIAGASIGMRLGAGSLGALIMAVGAAYGTPTGATGCTACGVIAVGALFPVSAMVIDDVVLARKKIYEGDESVPASPAAAVLAAPYVTVVRGGTVAGFSGTF